MKYWKMWALLVKLWTVEIEWPRANEERLLDCFCGTKKVFLNLVGLCGNYRLKVPKCGWIGLKHTPNSTSLVQFGHHNLVDDDFGEREIAIFLVNIRDTSKSLGCFQSLPNAIFDYLSKTCCFEATVKKSWFVCCGLRNHYLFFPAS